MFRAASGWCLSCGLALAAQLAVGVTATEEASAAAPELPGELLTGDDWHALQAILDQQQKVTALAGMVDYSVTPQVDDGTANRTVGK